MKPYYDDGTCVIYHGDCREVVPDLYQSGALDMTELTLTDPPYNLGVHYSEAFNDDLAPAIYEKWLSEWWSLICSSERIVFPGLKNLPTWCLMERPTAIGCWYIPGNPGRGFPWSFVEWEPFLIYGTTMLGGSNVLRHPVTSQANVGDHPCPKPLGLFTNLILRAKSDTVVDPFLGSGTTLRAAKDLGRKAIGIEIEEKYCEIAARRLGQEVLAL